MREGLPVDALRAEIEAWPFISRAAFKAAIMHLELGSGLILAEATQELWNCLEGELRIHGGRVSLAELTPLRDATWFSNRPDSSGIQTGRIPLHNYLGRLACCVLEDVGCGVSLRFDTSTVIDSVERWRWLSIYLPPELLLAALAAQQGHLLRDRVELVPQPLGQLLRTEPVAQQHLHHTLRGSGTLSRKK
jgi:hypothetical protein